MSTPRHYRWNNRDLLLHVRVSPRASRDSVGEIIGDRIKISITAPPVDGKANQHLCKFVAKLFGVRTSQTGVVRGSSSRDKTLRISQPRQFPSQFGVETESN